MAHQVTMMDVPTEASVAISKEIEVVLAGQKVRRCLLLADLSVCSALRVPATYARDLRGMMHRRRAGVEARSIFWWCHCCQSSLLSCGPPCFATRLLPGHGAAGWCVFFISVCANGWPLVEHGSSDRNAALPCRSDG